MDSDDREVTYRSLADADTLAARVRALKAPHMYELNQFVRDLRATGREVPWFDPCDGGNRACLLILLESPARRNTEPRFVSCDNPTPTGRNIRRFLADAGVDRHATLLWNVVPWVLESDKARNRKPNRPEIVEGLNELPKLLAMLEHLSVVVAAGRVAAQAASLTKALRPEVTLFEMPHPSPVYVNTDPSIRERITTVLRDAAIIMGECPGARPGENCLAT